jgi:hypothetical protein
MCIVAREMLFLSSSFSSVTMLVGDGQSLFRVSGMLFHSYRMYSECILATCFCQNKIHFLIQAREMLFLSSSFSLVMLVRGDGQSLFRVSGIPFQQL